MNPMQLPIEWLPERGHPEQLIVLLHGFGADGRAMAPLAQALRHPFAQAALLAPDAPQAVDPADADAPGPHAAPRQWYGVEGLTPELWPQRVAAALPPLQTWIAAQQQRLGVSPAATALAGFSQGAVVALALALQHDGLVGRVLSFGGCLTAQPVAAPRHTTLHLFHGEDDTVIPADGTRQALAWLSALQGDATMDIASAVGHTLHPALIDCALHRLQTHIPLRTWQAALGAVPALPAGAMPQSTSH